MPSQSSAAFQEKLGFSRLLLSLYQKHFMQIKSLFRWLPLCCRGLVEGRRGEGVGRRGEEDGALFAISCSEEQSRAETRLMMLSGYKISSL